MNYEARFWDGMPDLNLENVASLKRPRIIIDLRLKRVGETAMKEIRILIGGMGNAARPMVDLLTSERERMENVYGLHCRALLPRGLSLCVRKRARRPHCLHTAASRF